MRGEMKATFCPKQKQKQGKGSAWVSACSRCVRTSFVFNVFPTYLQLDLLFWSLGWLSYSYRGWGMNDLFSSSDELLSAFNSEYCFFFFFQLGAFQKIIFTVVFFFSFSFFFGTSISNCLTTSSPPPSLFRNPGSPSPSSEGSVLWAMEHTAKTTCCISKRDQTHTSKWWDLKCFIYLIQKNILYSFSNIVSRRKCRCKGEVTRVFHLYLVLWYECSGMTVTQVKSIINSLHIILSECRTDFVSFPQDTPTYKQLTENFPEKCSATCPASLSEITLFKTWILWSPHVWHTLLPYYNTENPCARAGDVALIHHIK